ncbi:hypothetical protein JCM3774_006754 [Rhodotorula dairenensis]
MNRTKARRTRSPLSLWVLAATATAWVTSGVAGSAFPPRAHLPAGSDSAPAAEKATSSNWATTPAFPSGILGLEAVGQELGHLGRHAEVDPVRRRRPWQQRGDGSISEHLHRQQKRQGSLAAPAATSTTNSAIGGPTAASPSSSTAAVSVTSGASSPGITAPSQTSTAPNSTSTSVPEGYALPQPFDSTLGTNFTSTACPSFFATFLADPTFRACAPFSLLLTTSTGFFQAERAPNSLLPYVLDAFCSAPLDTCAGLMDSLARKIKLSNTCARDLALGNPLVTEAVDGFNNYRLMRSAACQRSNATGNYCFADAATKADPSDLYLYYLPEGTTLPSGSSPECDQCTQGLMSIYASYATNSTLAISRSYSSGRAVVALSCGPTFAPVVATMTATSAALPSAGPRIRLALLQSWLGAVLLAVFVLA